MDLDDLRAFLAVAEAGSVLAAADALKIPRTTLRRRLEALEARTGAVLLSRGSQGAILTEAGERLARRGRRLIEDAGAVLAEVRDAAAGPAGVLRVVLPVGMPPHVLAPLFLAVRAAYPWISVDMRPLENPLSASPDEVDVVFHLGDRVTSGPWITRRLISMREWLVASPAYLERRGRPMSPAELAGHDLLCWRPPGRDARVLPLVGGGELAVDPVAISSDIHLVRQVALAGGGIAFLPDAGFPDPEGVLEAVLPDQVGRECPLRYLAPEALATAPRVRAVLDALAPFLAEDERA